MSPCCFIPPHQLCSQVTLAYERWSLSCFASLFLGGKHKRQKDNSLDVQVPGKGCLGFFSLQNPPTSVIFQLIIQCCTDIKIQILFYLQGSEELRTIRTTFLSQIKAQISQHPHKSGCVGKAEHHDKQVRFFPPAIFPGYKYQRLTGLVLSGSLFHGLIQSPPWTQVNF